MSSINHIASKPIINQPIPSAQQHKQHEKHDIVAIIGRIASVLSVLMYVSYLTQIANNLGGAPRHTVATALRLLQLHHVDDLRLHEAEARHSHHCGEYPRNRVGTHHIHHRHCALARAASEAQAPTSFPFC